MNPGDPEAAPGPHIVREDIAIVGMSCLFAGSPDLDAYWKNIVSKADCISDPPADEWDPSMFYDPASKANDRIYCKRGGYIGDLANFRPFDFGVMPITVEGGEPDQWLALRVAHEALADAGYPESPKEHERTEVILGKGTYVNRGNLTVGYHGMTIDYVLQVLRNLHPEYSDQELQEIKQELKSGLPPFSADTAPALIGNIIAGRIANRLDLMGSSFTVDAACASALLAIEIGVRDLISRKCDLVLAGGANANAPLPTLSLFCQLGALSRQEQIRPFDKNADGTILGEGLGMIVLKRRADAERDGNRIYAFIKGVGIASDGRALHVMAPRVEGEELALQRAYEMAGFSPSTVGLIEAHGTATPVGDVVEVQALSRVFGERQGTLPSCAIGSVKSMIGHTMPAAGIAGVIKTALALYHRVLPPSIHCEEPNPALNLHQTPFYVNTETRPWIHGAGTPRRAGVNSFGFGGINGHVVLEETPAGLPQPQGYLTDWETEVVVLEATSRAELIEQGNRLKRYLERSGESTLKDIAYSLNTALAGQPCRLAIVAASKEELGEKLTQSLARLADPKCKQIKDNRGIYFFDQRLEGKLAFLFPGEGAQYPNMLLDLCLHFPEVRSCFDLADRAIFSRSRQCLPSEFIFPRSTLSKAEQSEVDRALWQIDGAVEGVLIANWAMWTLLNQLAIKPDVIMGHSTGDYSAMFASNIIGLSSEASYVETIVAWNEAHARLSTQLTVPEVTLVAVAADSATVLSIVEAIGGDLHLAMDNCPHQSVLLGPKPSVERAIELLKERGLMYEILPFDRPYHTPLFLEYAEGAGTEFFARLPIAAPNTPVYSCTSAALYPQDVQKIRELFVDHWAQPVLFTKTVQTMYDEGVRLFVETGPRGNLTAFVSDILRGKPHLAMPANIARRSGISQLNHLVGVLAAQGVGMQLNYLYARRHPQRVDWEAAVGVPVPLKAPPMKVSLAIPQLKVKLRPRKPKPVEAQVLPVASNGAPNSGAPNSGATYKESEAVPARVAAAQPPPPPVAAPEPVNPRALAMQQYVKSMEEFLTVEQRVMESFLNRVRQPAPASAAASAASSAAVSAPLPERFPLLGTVTSLTPGESLTAVRQLSLGEDSFLREHALGGPVSVTDPTLQPMVVVPLTMSMELLAEAAAALQPGLVLTSMRNIQAHHWIRVDDAPVDLHISAKSNPASPHEIEVEVRDSPQGVPAVRGIMVFGSAYPPAPAVAAAKLKAERASTLSTATLYDGKLMFHGAAFQGVQNIDRSGQDGIIGRLRVLPAGKLFRFTSSPRFVTDPVVLDAAGQMVGFWAAEYLNRGFVVFPYGLDSLRIYAPQRPAGEVLTCQVRLQQIGNERIVSEIDIVAADGSLWMQFSGWGDRRFDPPQRFHRAWTTPLEASISEPWPLPAAAPNRAAFECCRLGKLFPPGSALWQDLWATLVLSRQERSAFATQPQSEAGRTEWLAGRTAAKDAVRLFLKKHYNLELLPADIQIVQDSNGKLQPQGSWSQQLRALPQLSFAQVNGAAVALVGQGDTAPFGVDVQSLAANPKPVLPLEEQRLIEAIAPAERAEWTVRLLSGRKAVAAAVGTASGLSNISIHSFDRQTGVLQASYGADRQRCPVYTARDGDSVTAAAIFEKEIS